MSLALTEPTWTLGNRLWKARVHADLSQANIAAAVGVSRALVSRWEQDLSDPRFSHLQKISEATGVSFEWLAGTKTCFTVIDQPAERSLELVGAASEIS